MHKFDHNIGFWEKRQYFCRKLSKIAENCDHNIGPWVICGLDLSMKLVRRQTSPSDFNAFLPLTHLDSCHTCSKLHHSEIKSTRRDSFSGPVLQHFVTNSPLSYFWMCQTLKQLKEKRARYPCTQKLFREKTFWKRFFSFVKNTDLS
jgi:hypothetical protein